MKPAIRENPDHEVRIAMCELFNLPSAAGYGGSQKWESSRGSFACH
jgi:hypothetical protein